MAVRNRLMGRNRLTGAGSAIVLAVCLGLAGCGKSAPKGEDAAVADPSAVAALVNGQPIYVSDVELEAKVQDLIDNGEKLEVDSAEFNEILDQLIDVKLLAMEAMSRGLDEEPESRHRLASARDNILGNILVDRVVEERVDEAAIKKMYETQIAIWELGDEAHVRHILAPSKEEIDKIAAELKSGVDFAVLASRKSTDEATRMEGGDLGYMTAEEATPEFAKVIRDTPTGGVSKPFETDMGWHIAKIDERRKEQPPSIEELRGPILKHLTMMQIGEVLKELRTEAKIEKQTSPRNSTLDVDPFETPAEEPAAKPGPAPEPALVPPSFEASVPRPPVSDSRNEPAAAAPAAAASPPPAATTKPAPAKPEAASAKPAAVKPAAATPAPATTAPASAKTTTPTPAKTTAPAPAKPTATPATSQLRPSTTPPAAPPPAAGAPAPSGPVSETRQGDGQ
jgi:peptidyl-prolyl cis-trans isomerase C